MDPGTTSTSRFAAKASSAVEKVPDGRPASTINVARARPAMRRFRSPERIGPRVDVPRMLRHHRTSCIDHALEQSSVLGRVKPVAATP